jgi:hypothetical protein
MPFVKSIFRLIIKCQIISLPSKNTYLLTIRLHILSIPFTTYCPIMLDLPLCQERQEENRRSNVCILGTKTREMMNESRISGTIVVATSSLIVWGS